MDGLLILLLLGWIFKKLTGSKKKNGKTTKTVKRRPVQFDPLAKAQKPAQQPQSPVAEGETVRQIDWNGSLDMDSTEGEDLCDPTLEHARETPVDPESVYAGEIGREPLVDTSAKGLLQGVIMSEILTRPSQRSRR